MAVWLGPWRGGIRGGVNPPKPSFHTPSADGRGGLLSRGDTAAPHGYATTVGGAVDRQGDRQKLAGTGRSWQELADTNETNYENYDQNYD